MCVRVCACACGVSCYESDLTKGFFLLLFARLLKKLTRFCGNSAKISKMCSTEPKQPINLVESVVQELEKAMTHSGLFANLLPIKDSNIDLDMSEAFFRRGKEGKKIRFIDTSFQPLSLLELSY